MKTDANNDLTPYNGLRIKARAKRFERIDSHEKLLEVISTTNRDEPVHILGDGTNTIWGSPFINKTILKIEIPGFEILEQVKSTALIQVGAGENWDKVIARAAELGLSGIEALSGIPGTAGAGPVQNIGAYGQELASTFEQLTIFDRESNQFKILDRESCHFGYRDSIFKHADKKFIITNISLRLSKTQPPIPNYPDVQELLKDMAISQITPQEIRDIILTIRARKLPDPKNIPNCGSFFKNPIIKKEVALAIQKSYPNISLHPTAHEDLVKISAAWLIEKLGFKGKQFNNVEVHPNHALILTNPQHKATTQDVLTVRNEIIEQVKKHFNVTLEMEPEIVT